MCWQVNYENESSTHETLAYGGFRNFSRGKHMTCKISQDGEKDIVAPFHEDMKHIYIYCTFLSIYAGSADS